MKEKIRDYWFSLNQLFNFRIDYEDALSICWKCTKYKTLEECHIIPKSLGGLNDPSNLVLLCKDCHKQNPNVNDKEYYINWLTKSKNWFGFYGTSETVEILKEVILENLNTFSVHEFNHSVFKDLLKNCSSHFGEGTNRETKKYLLIEYFKKVNQDNEMITFDNVDDAFKYLGIE